MHHYPISLLKRKYLRFVRGHTVRFLPGKSNSESLTIIHDKTESWGLRFNSNSNVIEGNYFQSIDGDPLKVSLIRRTLAIMPAVSAVFICDDDDIENSSSDGLLVKLFDSIRQSIVDCIKMCDYVR
jgi:hypothetical protein